GSGDECQSDTGIAAGGLDDYGILLEHAAPLGVFDHRHANPILHTTQGVEEFALDQHSGFDSGSDTIEAHQRSASDSLDDVVVDATHILFLGWLSFDET